MAVYDKKNWPFDQWISVRFFKIRQLILETLCIIHFPLVHHEISNHSSFSTKFKSYKYISMAVILSSIVCIKCFRPLLINLCILLHSHEQLYIHICMKKHKDAMKTSRHRSLEKYTSHFIWKGCVWEGVEDWTELQHIDPHSSGYHSLSFLFSWLLNRGLGGLSLSGTWFSFQHLLSNCSEALNYNCSIGGPAGCWFSYTASLLQLTELPVAGVI